LRYSGPVHMIMRQTEDEVQIEDSTIPAGATCIMMLAAANRDERHFSNPDEFDIFRTDLNVDRAFSGAANHVQFILGRHFCVGSMLAKTEMTIALNLVLDTMDSIEYQDGFVPRLYTRSIPELRVKFEPTGKLG
ncbi:MAG: cytochrome P450, partial [Acidobacteria bacterium]